MKKIAIFLLVALLLLTLCGCGQDASVPATVATTAVPETTDPVTEPTVFITEPEPVLYETSPIVEPDPAAREAFQAALQKLLTGNMFPDGTPAPFVSDYGPMEQNRFAIFDADGDGREELLLAFTTTFASSGQTHIYGFDGSGLHLELLDAPFLTVYTGGLIQADASHNHTYAGDTLWPHQLYRYDPETDVYEAFVYVDAWERRFGETHVDGTPYPEELDQDKIGAVYLIYTPTWGEGREMLSKGDFEAWQAALFADAQPMQIPYQPLTGENIAAVTKN